MDRKREMLADGVSSGETVPRNPAYSKDFRQQPDKRDKPKNDSGDGDFIRPGPRRPACHPAKNHEHGAAGEPAPPSSAKPPENAPVGIPEEEPRPGDSGAGRRPQCLPPPDKIDEMRGMPAKGGPDDEPGHRIPAKTTGNTDGAGGGTGGDPLAPDPPPPYWSGLAVVAFAGGAVLAFFAFAQFAGTLASLSQAPAPWRWIGCAGLLTLVALIFWAAFRTFWFWRGLRPNAQVPWLKVRATRGAEGARTWTRAKEMLLGHLRSYESLLADGSKAPFALLVDDGGRRRLRRAKDRLLEPRPLDGETWTEEYEREFLAVLDERAEEAIRNRARMIALQTMMMPGRALDIAVFIYHQTRLLEELARVYNQRMNRRGALGTLARIILSTGAAGGMEAATEAAGDMTAEAFSSVFPEMLSQAAAKTVGKVVGKLAEGGANYIIARRLGRRIQNALRPLV